MDDHPEPIGFLGEHSRLSEAPSRLLADGAFAAELEAARFLWSGLSLADLAHTQELIRAGVIDHQSGQRLLRDLLEFHDVPLNSIDLDPHVGDLYNNRDKLLQDRSEGEIGRIHTGRARREAVTIAWHLRTRELVATAAEGTSRLMRALVQVARAHRRSLMPDYTYLQHAHPTVLGHYLLGFAYPLARDAKRLEAAFGSVNLSPAGSGSVNGSRLPIDRERLARALEFDGLIVHTRDAMWAPDIAQAVAAPIVSIMTTVDRLAEELQIWATTEFGIVSLADRHSRTSVIMPQKKNPYSLAMLRGHARAMVGDAVAITTTNQTTTGQPDNRTTVYTRLPQVLERATLSVDLLAEVLREATFHTDRMQQLAGSDFAYSTDMCDYLVQATGIDNRSAHRIVGLAVRRALDDEREVIAGSDVRSAANDLDIELADFADADLERNRDPYHLISLRRGTGGAGHLDPMFEQVQQAAREVEDRFRTSAVTTFEPRFLEAIDAYTEGLT